ncbi:Serine/threonine-protein kinase CTR1 [Geodia barretti]|uniref:Serine/threonine-protein kinase CTR1 n=1 Tax=Geodia barretti TaxID=519541 RepID=A0AA35SAA3_GEOBA|nr:Serine/threonine-protein kinase CTR1 [Geodia barretti]
MAELPACDVIENDEVHLKSTLLHTGRYATVREADIAGAKCAAKIFNFSDGERSPSRQDDVVCGCKVLDTLRHPNLVSFLGITQSPDSVLPVLLVEYLPTSLHRFLSPAKAEQSIPLGLKISILQNVACGLAYLHIQSPPILHGHLSAKKVLLTSGAVAKISVDVGVTVLPQPLQTSPYMPPEITGAQSPCTAAVDIFSFGVLSLFTLTQDPPNNILPQTYTNESKQLICRSEIERCSQSMEKIFRELGKEHPLGKLITSCLNQQLASRPTAANLVETHSLLWQAAVLIPDPFQEKTKVDLVHHTHNLACAHVRMRRELESHDCEQRDQIRGLLQGMARQREMLPTEDGEEEDKEMVSEQEIAYIANFVEGIQADKLGRELGVCESTLEIINCESANRCDENRKRANVLRQWLRNTSSPTWEALVKALGSIGQKRVADILRNDKGLQYCTTITERGSEQSQAELRKVEAKSADDGKAAAELKSQLEKARKSLEIARSSLSEANRELEEANKKCNELQETVSNIEKEMRGLRHELKGEELFRKELADENLQLKLEVERLKRK